MKRKQKRYSAVREYLLDLLFPSKCILCRKLIGPGGPRMCPDCANALLDKSETEPELKKSLDYLSGCVSAAEYTGRMRTALIAFKFGGKRMYAEGFADLISTVVYKCEDWQYDMVSWLPVSPDRKRTRGYDQAQLIAECFSRMMMKPLVSTLRKKKHVKPQSEQADRDARKENIKGAYSVIDSAVISGKRILLIDDIITTGATMSEGAKTLLKAGAEAVYGASAARTFRYSDRR